MTIKYKDLINFFAKYKGQEWDCSPIKPITVLMCKNSMLQWVTIVNDTILFDIEVFPKNTLSTQIADQITTDYYLKCKVKYTDIEFYIPADKQTILQFLSSIEIRTTIKGEDILYDDGE